MNRRRIERSPTPSAPGGTVLGRDAERLLAVLDASGAYAFADPTEDGALLVRVGGTGVSLGSGRFRRAAADALVAADLAAWSGTPGGRLTIGAAGRARLRRQAAPDGVAYLGQHRELAAETVDGDREPRLRDVSESPVAWMARRRGRDGTPLLDAAAVEAGERLRRDLTIALVLPRTGMNWGAQRVDGAGPRDPSGASDAIIAARQRVRAALDAVGNDLAGLLLDLCGFLKGLELIEAERHWPSRSAKVVARIALGRLAEHYGLEREASGPDRGRSRLWRDPS